MLFPKRKATVADLRERFEQLTTQARDVQEEAALDAAEIQARIEELGRKRDERLAEGIGAAFIAQQMEDTPLPLDIHLL